MSKFDTHGGYFAPKDYLRVNEGGSHEENPNGGVQIGVDPEGNPNLLEEGEPVYKDYVYSDNIEAEREFLEQNHLPGKYAGKLYSKIADDLFSEAEERPLDPISRNGLEALLGRLADAQEGQKSAKEQEDLEAELSSLSPEELDQLEQMLAQGQQAEPMTPEEEVYGTELPTDVPVGTPEVMGQEVPMMRCGGTLLHKYGMGGPTDDELAKAMLAREAEARKKKEYEDAVRDYRSASFKRFFYNIGARNANTNAAKMEDELDRMKENYIAGKHINGRVGEEQALVRQQKRVDRAKARAERQNEKLADIDATRNEAKARKEAALSLSSEPLVLDTPAPAVSPIDTVAVQTDTTVTVPADTVATPVKKGGINSYTLDLTHKFGGPIAKADETPVNKFQTGGPEKRYWRPGGMWTGLRSFDEDYPVMTVDPAIGSVGGNQYIIKPKLDAGAVVSGLTKPLQQIGDDSYLEVDELNPSVVRPRVKPVDIAPDAFDVDLAPFEVPSYEPEDVVVPHLNTPYEIDPRVFDVKLNDEASYEDTSSSTRDSWNEYLNRFRSSTDTTAASQEPSKEGTTSTQNPALLPTWSRYAGAVGSGLLGLYNAFQKPDKYTAGRVTPYVPEGRIHLQNQVYNPIDQNMIANAQIAQGNATNRALRNSGLGPGTAAAVLAADNNLTGNLGTGFIQTWDANNQRRNAVIAANNQAEAQRANFDYTVDAARKSALRDAAVRNAQNDLILQRLNYGAEGDKYTAISNQISNGLQALSGIGKENFAMNQINTNPAFLGYGYGANGGIFYNPVTHRWEMAAPATTNKAKVPTAPQKISQTSITNPTFEYNSGRSPMEFDERYSVINPLFRKKR